MTKNWSQQVTTAITEPSADKVLAIDIDRIKPNPFQPRREIAPDKIAELAKSIEASGLIQPIVVRRAGTAYQLVVGERRYLACKKLGWKKISAAVKTLTDHDMAAIALIENLQRENLNIVEEASGYVRLMNNFDLTQEDLAKKLGKSQSTIANKVRLLKLPAAVLQKVQDYNLSERHARALLKLNSEKQQLTMIEEIGDRGLTVNQTEKRIEKVSAENQGNKRMKGSKPIIRDMRIVLNTIRDAIAMIQSSGLYPEVEEIINPDYIEVKILLTKEMLQDKTIKDNAKKK